MAVQQQLVGRLPMLMQPATPPKVAHITYGYRYNKQHEWALTDYGRDAAAIAQRVLLRYALDYESRGELRWRYSISERELQEIISGNRSHWFTSPVRVRLLANGIGNPRMKRSPKGCRVVEVRLALERLAARAWNMMLWPEHYPLDLISEVTTDLYLLSGAWREDEER